jgi:hypothetical protein
MNYEHEREDLGTPRLSLLLDQTDSLRVKQT